MNDYAVQLLTRMLEIYSPSGKEETISRFIAQEMKRLGFNTERDNVGNVIGETGIGTPIIFLCGHMDTVAGFIPVKRDGAKLFGRGAVDAKASLAAMISAASTFTHTDLAKIIVAAVVDEEGKSRGIRNILKKGLTADYAIFGEPSGVEKITVAYRGLLRLKITCRTEACHSGAPWLSENAVEKALEMWEDIRKICYTSEATESRFHSLDSCLTQIRGGRGDSTIPAICQIHIDFRIPPKLTAAKLFAEVQKRIRRYKDLNPKLAVKVEIKDSIDPFETDPASPLVHALSRSIREVRKKTAIILKKTGTGDMNIFGRVMNIPVVTYGPGNSALSHTENEYIDVQEFLDGVKIYQQAISNLAAIHKNS